MTHIRGQVVINRPVEDVFDFVADECNEPRYNPSMRSAERLSPGPIRAGTRFHGQIVNMGRPYDVDIVYRRFERPHVLASSIHMSSMDVEGTLRFDPVPGGTRMRWAWDVRFHGLFQLLSPLGGRFEEANWRRLKRVLEGTRRPAAGYFNDGLPYNRFGSGTKPLIVFQGLVFENKPMTGLLRGLVPGRYYRRLEQEWTTWLVGRKPGLPPRYSLRDMANDYASMIRREFAGPVDIIGVSTGGSIAQHFAADHPDLVSRLVLHSTACKLSVAGRETQQRIADLARRREWAALYGASIQILLPDSRMAVVARPAVWVASRLAAWLTAPRDLADLVVTIEAEDEFDFASRLGEITAPTLVVAGDHDPFYSESLFRETAAGIPRAKLILYKGMGHPAAGRRFARDVRSFLREDAG